MIDDSEEQSIGFLSRVGHRIFGDAHPADAKKGDQEEADELGFPYSDAQPYARPIGTLFKSNITNADYTDMYRRYPLAKRIVDMPIEEAFGNGFTLVDDHGAPIPDGQMHQAMNLFQRDRMKIIRFCKLVQLFGHSVLVFGYTDPRINWSEAVSEDTHFAWVQPVPVQNEQELKVSETLPITVLSVTTNFGSSMDRFDTSRIIFAMNPKLIEEDKMGMSVLEVVYNALDVQIHSNWSIGQSLWRSAGGLLGLFAPKKKQSADEKQRAITSVANHNAKTVLYIPNGWAVKEILRSKGNMAIQRTYQLILQEISAGCGIPVSVLIGSQFRDVSEADTRTYLRTVYTKQENLISPILRKYFRMGQLAGMIDPGSINIAWNPLEYKTPLSKQLDILYALAIEEATLRFQGQGKAGIDDQQLVKLILKATEK